MSIQRYKALNGCGSDADLAKDNDGEIVLFTDHLEDVRQQLFHLLSTLADIRRESGLGDGPMLSELAGEIGKLKSERDTLKACLASHDSHGPDGRNVTNSQFAEMRDERDAAVRERDVAVEAIKVMLRRHGCVEGCCAQARVALAKIGGQG